MDTIMDKYEDEQPEEKERNDAEENVEHAVEGAEKHLEKARNQKHIAVKILRLGKLVKTTIANVGNV